MREWAWLSKERVGSPQTSANKETNKNHRGD